MKPFAVLLASHGNYAKEALCSVEMIIGRQENVKVLSIDLEKSVPAAREEFDRLLDELDGENGILILTDIAGGTPSNLAAERILSNPGIRAISGFNMPMLLELFSGNRAIVEDASKELKEVYKAGLVDLNERMLLAACEESL